MWTQEQVKVHTDNNQNSGGIKLELWGSPLYQCATPGLKVKNKAYYMLHVLSIETFYTNTFSTKVLSLQFIKTDQMSISLWLEHCTCRCAPLRQWTGKPTLHAYKYFITNSVLDWGWKKKQVAFSCSFTLHPLAITCSPHAVLSHNERKPYWKACCFPGRGFPSGWLKWDILHQLCLLSWKSWACNSPEADSSEEGRLCFYSAR